MRAYGINIHKVGDDWGSAIEQKRCANWVQVATDVIQELDLVGKEVIKFLACATSFELNAGVAWQAQIAYPSPSQHPTLMS